MCKFNNTIFLILLFLNPFLAAPVAHGQGTDTLEVAVDRIIRDYYTVSKEKETVGSADSVLILGYLDAAKRSRANSPDSSAWFLRKAVSTSLGKGYLNLTSVSLQKLGVYYAGREMYREAMSCFVKSLRIEEALNSGKNNQKRIADLYDEVGTVYYYLEIFSMSLHYHEYALEIYNSLKDTLGIARVLSHLGSLHSSREFCEKRTTEEKRLDFNIAISYLEKSIRHFSMANDSSGIARGNQNIAAVYNKFDKPGIALQYIGKSLDYYRKVNDPEGILSALYTMGKTYYMLGEYEKSISAFRESEKISLERNQTEGVQYLYEAMAMPYYATGDYKSAYDYYVKYMTIRDSVYNAEKSRQILELEAKYQNQVKENEILRLTAQKSLRNRTIYILSILIFILGTAVYYNRRINNKNKIIAAQDIHLKEDKILELERERQLLASRSVMEGEEAERTRLAGDLHNGLGGLLSGIKINLSTMKGNPVLSQAKVNEFNHAISLIDTSIFELRRIAHNLMPETLNHYGLKIALEDFCSQVTPTGKPEIVLQFFGEDLRYNKETELSLYRISQELINNALKHSGASTITVQLIAESRRLCVLVSDNGTGFEVDFSSNYGKVKGLRNINDRVTALNGKFDIWSQPGQGTEISVELEITQ